MQKIIGILLIISFLCWSCSDKLEQKKEGIKTGSPTISSIKNSSGLPPIYEHFDDLAPIFHKQTDTTYIINFWSTWCAPCIKELPYFEALNQKYATKKVKVILISLDFKKQLETKLKPFLAKNQLKSEVLVLIDPDANSWLDKVNPDWSGAIPATLVYKGEKNQFYEQPFESLEELEMIIKPFL